ncbi:MAG: diversity-generating retroelement protein Avd [Caldilineaceae bacterium]|nr:diversity-generating retroelement protein Avd [Caldilineaceae bacterium]
MSESYREMPIFTRTFDFLDWLIPQTNNFPRFYRHTVTRRLLDAALDLQEALLTANTMRGRERLAHLTAADAHLSKIRVYLRLAHRRRWLNPGQYQHAGQMVAEIGKLLGGWQAVSA